MSSSIELSDSDRKFLEIAMTCFKAPPELDIQKIADIMGVKPKSASNKWWEIRKKIFAGHSESTSGGASSADGGEPSTPSTASKRKRGATKKGNDEGTPTKKTRGRPRAATAVKKTTKGKALDVEDDSDSDGNFADESNIAWSDHDRSLKDQVGGDDIDIDVKDEVLEDKTDI